MNDWIHCNKCSIKPHSNVKLFITECGHLFCQRCTENLKDSKCVICNKSVKIIPISNDMDASIQRFFIPIETHLNKILEVYNFQMQHRGRLVQTTLQKYNYAKKECISAFNKYREVTRENKTLKSTLMSRGKFGNPHPFTSTPFVNASQADTMSISSVGFTPNVCERMHPALASGPGIAKRIPSRDSNFMGPYLPPVRRY
ncbi:probable E3 SUMO-protein ligase RNF212 [Anoplophora glabripennis]|uniref:probable E3 SUMO-protein ligase RNF212 n=1 Tax=Anoplophora glabripennis TaxID=217634 RepID=UPI000C777306|nr:probable E3 SUMO-protein ligase RNF212 [Anoplophora glabripennis]